jgi:hypothetical protein
MATTRQKVLGERNSVLPSRARCKHHSYGPPTCSKCLAVRRRASSELDRVHPRQSRPRMPMTYGLTEDELRAEANRRWAEGWSMDEILTTLAIQPRNSTRPVVGRRSW